MNAPHPIRVLLASNLCGGPAFKPPTDAEADMAVERFVAQRHEAIIELIDVLDLAISRCASREFGLARMVMADAFDEETRFQQARALAQQLGNLRQLLTTAHGDMALPFVLNSVRGGLAELVGYQPAAS
ncbi:MAG TPA: hypothetical protein VJM32_04565 [Candidatus Saccharimonadales bacterium]|nr:hypothetical protein [Candidatus Saccharimonadales bacterium]